MKTINKVKTLLKAVVVIAVALAFVMPVTASIPEITYDKSNTSTTKKPF